MAVGIGAFYYEPLDAIIHKVNRMGEQSSYGFRPAAMDYVLIIG